MKTISRGRLSGLVVALLLGASVAACGGFSSTPLPVGVDKARDTFAPIAACAAKSGFEIAQHPDSVNVQVEPGIWVQYMIQGPSYNMVVVLSGDVPEGERAARMTAAKKKGDEIFACATH
ncbi:MAG: hypothetical protein U0359_23465 [Byssovorax sp.]